MDDRAPPLNQATVDFLIDTWIRYERLTLRTDRDGDFWAAMKLEELCRSNPDQALDLVIEILNREPTGPIVRALAEGPLEQLLAQHGSRLILRAEEEAERNAVFRRLLCAMPRQRISGEVIERIDHPGESDR